MLRTPIFIILISIISSCISIEQSVVNEDKYLGNKTNNTSIYSKKSNGTFINPFSLNTDNWGAGIIDRLMLVEFEPLGKYNCIELQQIENNGEGGALVILYYAEGKQADVYHSPNLQLDAASYNNILNNATVNPAEIQYVFEEEKGLLKASLDFEDRFGNHVFMSIDEKFGKMKPCGLLAPIGGEAEVPEFMTIVFMKHFKFLAQSEKSILVKINNEKADLLKLPIKANGVKGYQTKYSMEPVTVSWNKNTNGKLEKYQVNNDKLFKKAEIEIELFNNMGYMEIKRYTGLQNGHTVDFKFSPALPDLQCLSANAEVKGRFSMGIDEIEGIMAGKYKIECQGEKVMITIQPRKGYSPVPGKAWMKKMTWKAEITNTNQDYHIKSNWLKK